MRNVQRSVPIRTSGPGLYEITAELRDFVAASGIAMGLATAFCRHTSCSLLIQENADPDVRTDLLAFFSRLAPQGMDFIVHDTEGPDDMPAHIRAALTQTSISIPIADGAPVLGPGRGSTSSSTGRGRTTARWCCTRSGISPGRAARRPTH